MSDVILVTLDEPDPVVVQVDIIDVVGPPGPQGDPGIHVGPNPPTDPDIDFWDDTDDTDPYTVASDEVSHPGGNVETALGALDARVDVLEAAGGGALSIVSSLKVSGPAYGGPDDVPRTAAGYPNRRYLFFGLDPDAGFPGDNYFGLPWQTVEQTGDRFTLNDQFLLESWYWGSGPDYEWGITVEGPGLLILTGQMWAARFGSGSPYEGLSPVTCGGYWSIGLYSLDGNTALPSPAVSWVSDPAFPNYKQQAVGTVALPEGMWGIDYTARMPDAFPSPYAAESVSYRCAMNLQVYA